MSTARPIPLKCAHFKPCSSLARHILSRKVHTLFSLSVSLRGERFSLQTVSQQPGSCDPNEASAHQLWKERRFRDTKNWGKTAVYQICGSGRLRDCQKTDLFRAGVFLSLWVGWLWKWWQQAVLIQQRLAHQNRTPVGILDAVIYLERNYSSNCNWFFKINSSLLCPC